MSYPSGARGLFVLNTCLKGCHENLVCRWPVGLTLALAGCVIPEAAPAVADARQAELAKDLEDDGVLLTHQQFLSYGSVPAARGQAQRHARAQPGRL